MHILGLANGTANGNSEIVLKAALRAAHESDPSVTISWVHIPSVAIPLNPKPFAGSQDVSIGGNASMQGTSDESDNIQPLDDRRALLDAILDADAYIFSTPVYSHSPAGFLKAVFDRIGGPFIDAAFADTALEQQKMGNPRYAHMKIDPRLSKPRVVGFMAIGGSTTPDQFTMALPILHTLVYPMHVKVVDQIIFLGCGGAGTIIARSSGAFIERAAQLGRNIASQLGKPFDEAVFLGEESEGACPFCHLAKIELFFGVENKIGCVACGAQGHLKMHDDGVIRPVWDTNCKVSSITWAGKKYHVDDLQQGHIAEANDVKNCEDFEAKKKMWMDFHILKVKLPSQQMA